MRGRALGLLSAAMAAGLLLVSAGPGETPGRTVALVVAPPDLPWADCEIEARLVQRLTRHDDLRILTVRAETPPHPAFPPDHGDAAALAAWGHEAGAAYVVIVRVESERLEHRKSMQIPLVAHRYVALGVIEGELRVIDVARGRLALAEPFHVQKKGPQVFQGSVDNDIHDPDLHISAPDKSVFFRRLEEELAGRLVRRIGTVIRMR